MGSPNYPDESNELHPPSTNSLPMHGFEEVNDSDDNETNPSMDPYAGYEQLNLEDVPDSDDEDEDSTEVQISTNDDQLPTADTEIACEIWNAPRPDELDIKIDSTKSDEIKSVMSKVTLGAIEPPEWAKHIPETKWIDELLQEVRRNKSSGTLPKITPPDPAGPSSSK
ncbi:hypothetical protein Bhyg_04402 [Pseudolycoriella hygida]|uniref:Male-enhanced antigen 1 n=1 Tax=Pseudolycoriella hygida TaxID=35572 RepID=A0A9Q0NF60_9DIPT|nr:hypothetical protein Bhyg_04402 [Pseudolycoriella hygida]